jgi:tryptophanyl-tRNA synthetase
MKKLVSGIKPTGQMHLGNYLGAIKNWLDLQTKYDCFYFIADLHALTKEITPQELNKQTQELIIDLLALGLDPKKVFFFKQSDIIGHAELAWVFNCLMPIAELNRMTQFKDESLRQAKNINAGLLTYPVLQAADILLYMGEYVPVGEDQLQHLELTRIAARKFNTRYKKYFPEVKPVMSHFPRVMSLNDPDKKMSKSLGPNSYIAIRDTEETIRQKIKKAITTEIGTKNLLELFSHFGDKKLLHKFTQDLSANKLMNSELKEALADSIINFLKPIQAKIKNLEKNPQAIEKIMQTGAKTVQKIAEKNLKEIKKIVGF